MSGKTELYRANVASLRTAESDSITRGFFLTWMFVDAPASGVVRKCYITILNELRDQNQIFGI
jgi:hypothetical protein